MWNRSPMRLLPEPFVFYVYLVNQETYEEAS